MTGTSDPHDPSGSRPLAWPEMLAAEQRAMLSLGYLLQGQIARTPLIAATVLRHSDCWTATLIPVLRGRRHVVRFTDLLAFEPTRRHPDGEIRALRDLPADDLVRRSPGHPAIVRARRELFDLGNPAFDEMAGYFEHPGRVPEAPIPALVVMAQGFLGSFPRSDDPVELVDRATGRRVRSIAVAGIGWSGGPDIGRLVAEELGWGYTGLEVAAAELAGVPRTADIDQGYDGQIRVVDMLVANSNGVADDLVWAYNELRPIRTTIERVAGTHPIIYVEQPDHLLQLQVERWNKNRHELVATQNQITQAGTPLAPGEFKRLDLPPDLDVPRPPDDMDVFLDAYVELAFVAYDWLVEQVGAPPLGSSQRILSRLREA